MKLAKHMQKANVVTISHGLVQAQYNGCVYQEFDSRFKRYAFAVNATDFFTALGKLGTSFKVHVDPERIMLFDDIQDFTFTKCIPDEIIPVQVQPTQIIKANGFISLRAYATQDYPAFFLFKDTIEVLHPSMIVRATLLGNQITGSFSLCDLYKGSVILSHNQAYGIRFDYMDKSACIWAGDLEIEKPDTNIFFDREWPVLYEIPQKVRERWIACEFATFRDDCLELDDLSAIELIEGHGRYDGKLLRKVIRNATHWGFDKTFMYFQGADHYGVLENVDA